MHRDELLNQKKQEFERALQEWATEQQILQPGEQLAFSMEIKKIPIVVGTTISQIPTPIEFTRASRHSSRHYSSALDRGDWEKIFELDWSFSPAKALIMLLHERSNAPVSSSLFDARFSSATETPLRFWDALSRIKTKLKQASLPYVLTIVKLGRTEAYAKGYALFKVTSVKK
jgi:hypothetical protein